MAENQTTEDAEIAAIIADGILAPIPPDAEQGELEPAVRRIIYGD